MSKLGDAYLRLYGGICGIHPKQRLWHFQWLSIYYLRKTYKRILPSYKGRILDVGCGSKPYRHLFGPIEEYLGLDVYASSDVDIIVEPGKPWPLPDQSFDVIFASQVLEHVENLDDILEEMNRVLRVGGHLIMTFPFLYNEHGTPYDFRRFTKYNSDILMDNFIMKLNITQGAISSTISSLLLNWQDDIINNNFLLRVFRAIFLPIWMIYCTLINILSVVLDKIDYTDRYYGNVLIISEKISHKTHNVSKDFINA
jgi:SAM-dependent methyltransferase